MIMQMPSFNTYTVTSFLASLLSLSVALVACFKGADVPERKPFIYISFLIGIWTLFPLLTSSTTHPETQLILARSIYLFAGLFPFTFALLIHTVLPTPSAALNWVIRISKYASLFFILITFHPLYITSIQTHGQFRAVYPGPLYHIYVLYFSASYAYALFELWKGCQNSHGVKRNQLKYIFIAYLIAYFGGGGLHFLAAYIRAEPIPHDIFVMLVTVVLAYAILKYNLIDIDLAFRYGIIYFISSLLVGSTTAFFIWLLSHSMNAAVLGFFAPLAGYFLFLKLKTLLTPVVVLSSKKFKQHREENIESYRTSVVNSVSLKEWANNLVKSVQEIIEPQDIAVLVFDASEGHFSSVSMAGFEDLQWLRVLTIDLDSPLVALLQREKKIIFKENLDQTVNPKDLQPIQQQMQYLHAELCMPFFMNDKVVGLLALGAKKNQDIFNDLDEKSLWTVGRGAGEGLRVLLLGLLQQEYSSTWAHDLKRPFGPKGALQSVRDALKGKYGPLYPDFKERLKDMIEEMEFVQKYIGAVLNPLEHGEKVLYDIRKRILTTTYEKVKRRYESLAQEQGIEWSVIVPPYTLYVHCDAVVIDHRVIDNLVANAFRHTPRGGSIELGYKVESEWFVIYVKDSGTGIPKEILDTIFDRGTQGESKGDAGLGLYIVQQVAKVHAGRAWVESELGKGSTFYVSLPLSKNGQQVHEVAA